MDAWTVAQIQGGISSVILTWLYKTVGWKMRRWMVALPLGIAIVLAYGAAVNISFEVTHMNLRTSHCVTILVCTIMGFIGGEIAWQVSIKQDIYCYLSLYRIESKPQIHNGEYQLAIVATDVITQANIFPYPAGTSDKDGARYYSLRHKQMFVPIIHKGGGAWPMLLPIGDYQIDFATENGNWIERLEIYDSDGEIKARIAVTNSDGDVLFKSTSP